MNGWKKTHIEYEGYIVLVSNEDDFYPRILGIFDILRDAERLAKTLLNDKNLKVSVLAASIVNNWERDYEGAVSE